MSHAQAETAPERLLSERRRVCRWRPVRLFSSVGRVVDLSADGFRVVSRRHLEGTLEVAMYCRHERPIIVRARVVWVRRVGFDRFVVGMAFEERPARLGRRLASMLGASPPEGKGGAADGDDSPHE